jgi:hypothetical protein
MFGKTLQTTGRHMMQRAHTLPNQPTAARSMLYLIDAENISPLKTYVNNTPNSIYFVCGNQLMVRKWTNCFKNQSNVVIRIVDNMLRETADIAILNALLVYMKHDSHVCIVSHDTGFVTTINTLASIGHRVTQFGLKDSYSHKVLSEFMFNYKPLEFMFEKEAVVEKPVSNDVQFNDVLGALIHYQRCSIQHLDFGEPIITSLGPPHDRTFMACVEYMLEVDGKINKGYVYGKKVKKKKAAKRAAHLSLMNRIIKAHNIDPYRYFAAFIM